MICAVPVEPLQTGNHEASTVIPAFAGIQRIVAEHSVLGSSTVIPAHAGIQKIVAEHSVLGSSTVIPAHAGMTS